MRPELSYDGLGLDPDETYELTYEIVGGDDPMVSTLTITNGEDYTAMEERLGTPSADTELEAKVLDVARLGL
jgi:hypothetical protein